MNRIATAMGISALMVLCMLVPCINGIDADIEVEQVYVEDAPVIVYMEEDVPVVLDKIAAVTDRIEYSADISTIDDEDQIVIIDGNSVVDQAQMSTDISNLIAQGNPVIVEADSAQLFDYAREQMRFSAFAENAQVYCMGYTENGSIVCHSISGYADTEEALLRAYDWATNIETTYVNSTITSGIVHDDYYSYEKDCDGMGTMSGITIVSQIEDNDSEANYHLVHFQHGGMPTGDHSKSSLDIRSDVGAYDNQAIYDHQPTNEVNVTEVTFNRSSGAEVGSDGIGISSNFSATWSHTYSDVTYDDQSTLGSGVFYIKYDINECTSNGYNNLIVEPGMLVKVGTADGAYHYSDTYYAEFCNVVIHGAWHNNFRTFEMEMNGQINPLE